MGTEQTNLSTTIRTRPEDFEKFLELARRNRLIKPEAFAVLIKGWSLLTVEQQEQAIKVENPTTVRKPLFNNKRGGRTRKAVAV